MALRYPSAIESARQARRSVFLARQRLLNPTHKTLESCASHLRTAIDSLSRLQGLLEKPEPGAKSDRLELRKEVSALGREMRQVNALMQQASAFHEAMSNIFAPPGDNSIRYVAGGVVVARPESTLRVEG